MEAWLAEYETMLSEYFYYSVKKSEKNQNDNKAVSFPTKCLQYGWCIK